MNNEEPTWSIELYHQELAKEKNMSMYATSSDAAIYLKPILKDYRLPFAMDTDKIIHALSYSRYQNKTQVYSRLENDHISTRLIHVQLVSKIARTIARALHLNEDLAEAIALGHDIGHTPLGHFGESVLNELSLKRCKTYFYHHVQSVRNYLVLENYGKGLNLSVQVLDGILCHNGEVLEQKYIPRKKTEKEFLEEYELCYTSQEENKKLQAMTLEGCIVRISDVVAYIGRDIEDAILLKRFKRENIPLEIKQVLGDNNHDIINHLVTDIIHNSLGKSYIALSDKVYQALVALHQFNYQHIYKTSEKEEILTYYHDEIFSLYDKYIEDLRKKKTSSLIFQDFLLNMKEEYINRTPKERIVIDFIAGMTDEYLMREIQKRLDKKK